jgi:hypothetical protein
VFSLPLVLSVHKKQEQVFSLPLALSVQNKQQKCKSISWSPRLLETYGDPLETSTFGHLHCKLVILLFLQDHRETDRFFLASGVQLA